MTTRVFSAPRRPHHAEPRRPGGSHVGLPLPHPPLRSAQWSPGTTRAGAYATTMMRRPSATASRCRTARHPADLHALRPRIVGHRLNASAWWRPSSCAPSSRRFGRRKAAPSSESNAWASGSSWHSKATVPRRPPYDRGTVSLEGRGCPGAGTRGPAGPRLRARRAAFDRGWIHPAGRADICWKGVTRWWLDPGGLEVLEMTFERLRPRSAREPHAQARPDRSPVLSGIGNAYSDEILHRARLSPVQADPTRSTTLSRRLYDASAASSQTGSAAPGRNGRRVFQKVTAFRAGMAVHGRYGQPCPVCGSPVQRIVYAANEANYCATCQTGGRLLADRSLRASSRRTGPRPSRIWSGAGPLVVSVCLKTWVFSALIYFFFGLVEHLRCSRGSARDPVGVDFLAG